MAKKPTYYRKTNYIHVTIDPAVEGRKTRVYHVLRAKWGDEIGQIRWYKAWTQYCFFVSRRSETILNGGTLRDICETVYRIETARVEANLADG